MSFTHCPGIKSIIGPVQIITRTCPTCGEEVEFFSDESETRCTKCGHTLNQEVTPSCVSWCKYADECIENLRDKRRIPPSRFEELKQIADVKRKK